MSVLARILAPLSALPAKAFRVLATLGVTILATTVLGTSAVAGHGAASDASDTSASAQAAALPLGKQRFVVAIGGLRASSTQNWVRLGQYDFHTDGTVTERHWHWTQRVRVDRVYTGFVARNCPTRECNIQTAGGYQSTGASQTLQGTYTVSGNTLRVTWDSGLWEEWELASAADGELATLEYLGSNYTSTHGYGYGSNAAWDARASMSSIASADHTQFEHSYRLWKTTSSNPSPFIDSGDGSPFWVTNWSVCSGGSCLGARTSGGTAGTDYYVSPARSPIGHRRDTMWSWRIANADGRGEYCYTGNSHVKPMMQIIDDGGDFHGWVGVEASLNETVPDQGAYADDIGVFSIYG
ncbi:hypothetical protein [Phytoactinopolyspora halotolerans]|uniref:Uncharacterized protein n=1 Tax=Phytoactinopolyspora halotolerans TaxID=1981512 RepID=A0A6L9SFI7_9ACTN|nr:hypothetical protein [Phytoactinopolyspora halotolerans]NEE03222.1 hypothetical protein [Phytoactinopolyspora halotolerans]